MSEEHPTVKIINTSGNPNPQYKSKGAAAMDLQAAEDHFFEPGDTFLMPTGIKLDMRCDGCGRIDCEGSLTALLFIRSGLSLKGLSLANGVGLIDPDYQGEVKVALYNRSDENVRVGKGDRIAQLMFVQPTRSIELLNVSTFEETERGEGGFGSTGVN